MKYTNWMVGHQQNIVTQDIEDCGVLMPYNHGLWDDVPCGQWDTGILCSGEEEHHFICEFGMYCCLLVLINTRNAVSTSKRLS